MIDTHHLEQTFQGNKHSFKHFLTPEEREIAVFNAIMRADLQILLYAFILFLIAAVL